MPSKTAGWNVELQGVKRLTQAFKVLGDTALPYLKEGLEQAGQKLEGAINAHAPGSLAGKARFVGVRRKPPRQIAFVIVKHPAAKPMEFGRNWWKTQGRPVKHVPGQVARPFVGIWTGGGAIGDVNDEVKDILGKAIEDEFTRMAGAGPA